MHALVALHGQLGWVAALTPLSVDWMDRRGVAAPQLNPAPCIRCHAGSVTGQLR